MEKISLEAKKHEEYTLELTLTEIEFVRRSINGIHDFLRRLYGEGKTHTFVLYQLYEGAELDDIELVELEHKIYSQYHDNSGDLIEPNVE